MLGVEVIKPGEVGIVVRLGKAQETVLQEGMHFVLPFADIVQRFNIKVQKYEVEVPAETRDLQPVEAKFVITYCINSTHVVQVLREHGNLQHVESELVSPQTKGAFRQAATSMNAQEMATQRAELKQSFERELDDSLRKFGIKLLDIAILRLEFGKEYQDAVIRAQMAEQRAREAENMVKVANAEARAEEERAKGQARAEEELAKGQARAEEARAKGKVAAINMVGEALRSPGGQLFLQIEVLEAWKQGGSKVPNVLVLGEDVPKLPFLLNTSEVAGNGLNSTDLQS